MTSVILAFAISLFVGSKINGRACLYFICFGTFALIVPVRYIVYPVSQYLSSISAQTIFTDVQNFVTSSYSNAFGIVTGQGGDWVFALPAFFATVGCVMFGIQAFGHISKNVVKK